jgi:hypothetical protein
VFIGSGLGPSDHPAEDSGGPGHSSLRASRALIYHCPSHSKRRFSSKSRGIRQMSATSFGESQCYPTHRPPPAEAVMARTTSFLPRLGLPALLSAAAIFGISVAAGQTPTGSTRPVPLPEIRKETTVPVAQGVTLDFSDNGANNVTVQTSDNPGVAQVTSKTNAVTVAPGTAHVSVAVFGECPKRTGAVAVHCDPIPVYTVTINVRSAP